MVFGTFWSENGRYILPILVWDRVLFSRELRDCMNVFIFQFQMNKKDMEVHEFEMPLIEEILLFAL